jgi:nitrogen regulatory protein P-II 1
MPKMIILVLDEVEKLPAVLDKWQRQGASGVTVLESSGLARLLAHYGRDDIPLFPGLHNLLEEREVSHRTLFTVLGDQVDLDAFFDATESVTGPLDAPGSGIMVALPVLYARGLVRRSDTPRPSEKG